MNMIWGLGVKKEIGQYARRQWRKNDKRPEFEDNRTKRAGRGREGEGLRFYQEHVSVFEKRRKEMVGNPARGQMVNCLNFDFNDYGITVILPKGDRKCEGRIE